MTKLERLEKQYKTVSSLASMAGNTKVRASYERQADTLLRKIRAARSGNPARRKMTKTQRKAASVKRAKQTRIAKALRGFLKQYNPSMKCGGAKIRKNRGGSVTITPLKAVKRKR